MVDLLSVVVAKMSDTLDPHKPSRPMLIRSAMVTLLIGLKACSLASQPIGGMLAAPWTSWLCGKSKPQRLRDDLINAEAGRTAPHS
jgi:hypothetical protein